MATAERNNEAPNSAPLGAMGTLLRRLDMLSCTDDGGSISELKHNIHSIRDKLKMLSEVQDPPLTVNYWMKHARELSYDIEAYLDGLDAQTEDNLSDSDAVEEDNLGDSDAKMEDYIDDSDDETEDSVDDLDTTNMDDSIDDSDNMISGFRTRAEGMLDRYERFRLDSVLSCPTAATTIVSPPPSRDVVLVGMGNQITSLISLLQLKDQHHNPLKIVSILGDEGIGKSTLIQEIWHESFKERKIWPESQSEVKIKRAFVRMGKKPDVRMILRSILSQVSLQEPAKDSRVTNLIQDIRKHLEHKRYFIIVDDVCSLSVWDVVGCAFPHCSVGSRIITTTSDKEVALACCSYVLQHNYIMKPLNAGDCKELFIRTVVGSGTVNLQLSDDVSEEIKRKCGGLPLAIMWTAILMASQPEIKEKLCQLETGQGLSKMKKEENLDSDVKKFLEKNLRIESTPVEFLNQVLKLCYSSLPHYLKTCLLYLSVYRENYFFLKEDLVKLWIAEGFICTSEQEDKVEVAGRYFDVLVSLGLIQRMDINCNKQHHQGELVIIFLRNQQEEVVQDEGEEYPLRVHYVVHPTVFDFITRKSTEDNFITTIDYSQLTVAFKEKIRRLSLHFGSVTYATTPSNTGLSQVRTLSFMGLLSCMPSLVEFKLVRVLIFHLWDDDGDKKFPLAVICKLLLLKYLQVRCNVAVELPGHIGCLKHLETLEINSVVTAIPSDVLHLSRLLHLRLGLKQNLTLGPVAAVTAICADELLPPNSSSQIFELLLPICIFSRLPKWIPQLCKLSILEIVVRALFTTDINMLANLPALTALSLYARIPTAGKIVFPSGTFKALKYFRFMCGVLSLDVEEEAMPNLQQLMIGFNVHGREDDDILAGIQHLLNLQEVVASIGPTMDTEEINRIAAEYIESALKKAINKHPRPIKFKVKRGHQVEEEYCPPPLDHLSINELEEVPVIHGPKTEVSTDEQPINLDKMPTKDMHGIPQFLDLWEDDNSSTQQKSAQRILGYIETGIKIIDGFNEFIAFSKWHHNTFSQWVGSLGSSSKIEKQELKEDDVLKLQRSIQCLRDTLHAMCTIIDRVEWSHEDSVAKLLPRLKAAVYDAEDVLEVFRWYEQKVNIESSATPAESATNEFFKDFNLGNFNTKLTDIKNRLDCQFRLLETMGLHQATPQFDTLVRPPTTRISTEPKIFGRDNEIKELIRLLGVPANNRRGPSSAKRKRSADNEERVSVLPIVGIGGVGKTTLAQTISTHPRVKSHFDKIAWICVSDDFDVKRLTKEAIEQFSGKAPTKDSLDSLYADLADCLNKRRFLIVLDDIWDEDEELWNKFCAPFKHVLQGSMMLVTTRSQKVADIVRTSTLDPFALEGLKDNVFEKFFNQFVFGSDSSNNYHELKLIGKKILPKLKGSPLAAKTLGRLLRRRLEPAHWNSILESQLWKIEQKETDILPALRLSYIYLSFPLKRCFSFCAVYPKDYNFVKEDLAEIWVAEGFVEREHNIPLQQTACEYFEELEYLSFFQKLRGKYVMHDLIHDMAQLVSKDECFIVKNKKDLETIPQDVRHLSVLKSRDFHTSDLEKLCKQTKLRTLFCEKSLQSKAGEVMMQKWCTELLCMRVMVCAFVSSLPDSIGNMKNLRYLKILDCYKSNPLPTTVCCLYNLQLICARNCLFNQLPRGFTNLVNLIKFESKFLKIDAAMENTEGIRLLKKSKLITRELVISNLCEISKNEAAEIELAKKEYISSLRLEWSKGTPHLPGSPEHDEIEVFKALHPPTSIKSVCLEDYPGEDLPSWCHGPDDSNVFSSLTKITIANCLRLSSLEQFLQPAHMPAIKEMHIQFCASLVSVPVDRFGGLTSLEELGVAGCPKINSQRLLAPSLKKLYLSNSGNLVDDIDCRSLTKFHLSGYHQASLAFNREKVPLLTDLHISECSELETLNGGWPILKSLYVEWCPRLKWENGIVLPSSLQVLLLLDCGSFSVSCLENLTSLKSLRMERCEHIEYIRRDLWSSNLKALEELNIWNCEGLVSIGGPEAIAHIPRMQIADCPKLKEIRQPLLKYSGR